MTDQNKNVSHSPAPNLEQELLRFKSLEKDLHFSQERVLKLLHYSSQSLMILDKIGKILWVNHYTEIMTGYSYDELVGKNASILQSHHHSPEYRKYRDWQRRPHIDFACGRSVPRSLCQ